MADYCTECFKNDIHSGYDINLYRIAKKLKKGYSTSIFCEGCNIRAVYRDEDNRHYLARLQDDQLKLHQVDINSLKVLKEIRSSSGSFMQLLFGIN